ncbi:GTP pyrophosphokinase family protein [Microbacterium sediminicola]|uniref:GTP pyrophosphokinase family protein n=1 Tax=Microbacterium sediminicola TaxID=415210 RepID=A0ABN2I5A1_9MICO
MTSLSLEEADFSERSVLPAVFGPKIEALICDLLDQASISRLTVVHRVKSYPSAAAKMRANPEKYGDVADLHDLLGVRVITYMASDVELVVDALRGAFRIDEQRSADKQAMLSSDRFGYLSYHLVACITPERAALPEWSQFKGFHFEIQVRSILQHAWAEIEHDLGYKSDSALPIQLRRRFTLLAGLLELADAEFDAVSAEVAEHVARVRAEVAGGKGVPIDSDSLRALTGNDSAVARLDRAIADSIDADLDATSSAKYIEHRVMNLKQVGVSDTLELERAIAESSDSLLRFARGWLQAPGARNNARALHEEAGRSRVLPRGISMYYYYLHLLIERDLDGALKAIGRLSQPERFELLQTLHAEAFDGSS